MVSLRDFESTSQTRTSADLPSSPGVGSLPTEPTPREARNSATPYSSNEKTSAAVFTTLTGADLLVS